MDFEVGKYYILGPGDEYLDGPCKTYLGALMIWFFYYDQSARVKQWTASGWVSPAARWVKGAWEDS